MLGLLLHLAAKKHKCNFFCIGFIYFFRGVANFKFIFLSHFSMSLSFSIYPEFSKTPKLFQLEQGPPFFWDTLYVYLIYILTDRGGVQIIKNYIYHVISGYSV